MLNKIFKSLLIGAFAIFALTLNSCKKAEDTKVIITVVDINGTVVKDAKVRLHQDGQISPSGQSSEVSDEQWTDASGQTEHVFEYEATLNVDVWKKMGTDTLTGNNVIRLLKQKTVSKTIEID